MYPVCLNIEDKLCVVVGGGAVARRKVGGLVAAGGRVLVISPQVSDELRALIDQEQCSWRARGYREGDLEGAFLVFAATDVPAVQEQVVAEARRRGILLNVIDNPELCGFQVPATVEQGDLTIAVSTAGKSPAVAAMVRKQLEKEYGPEYAELLQLMGELRSGVIALGESPDKRKILFQNILHDDIVQWIRDGRWDQVRRHIRTVFGPESTFVMSQLEKHP